MHAAASAAAALRGFSDSPHRLPPPPSHPATATQPPSHSHPAHPLPHLLSAGSANRRSAARWRVVLVNPAPSTKPPPLPAGKSLQEAWRWRGGSGSHDVAWERGRRRRDRPMPEQAPYEHRLRRRRHAPLGQAVQEPEQLPGGGLALQLLRLLLQRHVPAEGAAPVQHRWQGNRESREHVLHSTLPLLPRHKNWCGIGAERGRALLTWQRAAAASWPLP